MKRPIQEGRFVHCDCLWVRPDLRGDGRTLRRLIKKTLNQHREKLLGGEQLILQREKTGFKEMRFDFPRFYRRFFL